MWHEARRQERKIRGMLVDYRRRAERRRDFYEKIKADPTQFLQIHGRQCKIHLDPSIAAAADSASAMMPWQGQADNLIDRFDVRAHLDYIPQVKKEEEEELTFEERQINYERYRIIAQNSFLAINEEKFLKQLHLEEQFGYTESKSKKEQRTGGASIGFNYEDNTAPTLGPDLQNEDESDGNSDSDLDVDLSINVSKMDSVQAHEMNRHGRNFGMSSNDFYSFLTNDLEEAESFRLAKEEEHEKALFSGRKSRRERRAHREKRLANRVISPPSYAARISPTYPSFRKSKSLSKSPSPENTGKITYITSFGDEEESPSTSKPNHVDKSRQGRNRRRNSSSERMVYISKRSYSRERGYKRRRSRSRDSRTKRRSWSRDRYKKSRSRSKGRGRSYRRKRSSSSSTLSSSSSSSSSSRNKSRSSSPKFRKRTPPSPTPSPPGKSKSKSPAPKKESPPKVIPRYYGRKKSDQSSSDLSDSSVKDVEMKVANSPVNSEKWSGYGNSGSVTKKTGQNLSIQERLKRKRQALLNKQFKADKIAEQLKTEREKQEQQHREDELREMAIKLRRRQREKRHAYDSNKSSSSSDSDSSKSKSPPPTVESKPKSPSPHASRRDEHRESRRFDRRDSSREKREHSRERRSSRSPRRCTEILIDMDCFYCQVEEKLNPKLKGKPVAVVQYNTWRGGGIIAVNYPARDEGVTRHMRGNEAKKKCPSINLVQVPEVRGKADLSKYRDAGKMVADVLATFTPLLQRASVDEAYLDITELVEKKIQTNMNDLTTKNLNNTFIVGCDIKDFLDNVIKNKEFCTNNFKLAIGGLIAEEIRHEVFTKTGYKCSAGIAHNKILAKLVCGLHKPNKQTILPQEAVENFFEITSINKVNSLGGKFGQTLSEDFQITFMGQLAKIPEKELIQKYDEKTGKWLFNIARGIDFEPVTTKLISKSIACCKKFQGKAALTTEESIKHWLHELAEEMIERLEKDLQENNRRAKQMVVSFSQENNKKDISSSRTQPLTLYNLKKIVQTAFDVIKKNCLKADGSYHLKFLGLSAGHFEDVSKVREITSFFQIGQNSKGYQKHKQKNECNEIKYLIKDENFDSTEAPNLIENVYYQLTQELQENPQDLVFYDDSCRIKNNNETVFDSKDFVNDFEKLADNANFEFQQNKYTDQLQKPSSSFFVKYFDDTEDFEEREKMLQIIEDEKDDFQETCEDVNEICPECKKSIPKSELLAHKDFHFALKLSRDEKLFENSTVKSIETLDGKKMHKSVKRKANSNNALLTFFIKNQKEDSLDLTEICLECNKKFRKEEINCHMDYHAAKRIHLEINATSSSTNCKKNPPKIKTKTTNKSVISFFKP